MKTAQLAQLLIWAGLATATPTSWPRAVPSLDAAAFAEAQQRDNTATRAFSNTLIKTSDGKCLFVDELSGDSRANLTPIQVADCGSTDGQGWDVITKGKHNNVANSILIVSTLTNACFNFDPRRAAGNQVLLFSCGGRADGGGQVTNSQLFSFNGTGADPIPFQPENASEQCLAVKGNVLDIASCGGDGQQFAFDGTPSPPATATPATSSINKRKKMKPEPAVTKGNSSSTSIPGNHHNITGSAALGSNTNGTTTIPDTAAAANNGTVAAASATKTGSGAKATSAATGKNGKNSDKDGKKKKNKDKGKDNKNKDKDNKNKDKNKGGKDGNNNGATGAGAAVAAASSAPQVKNGTSSRNQRPGAKGLV